MRLTDFWNRLEQSFGASYAASFAADHALTRLGSRTIRQALADGEEAVVVWRAVVEEYPDRIPPKLR